MISKDTLKETLESSTYWGGYGPDGEAPLNDGERQIIFNKIFKDLSSCYEANGGQYLSELWVVLRPALANQNWFCKSQDGEYWMFKRGGPFILCNAIYRKASRYAQKRMERVLA